MAVMQLRYNDDTILRKTCKQVLDVNDKIRGLLDNMMDTLHSLDGGAALAANQVGLMWRLVVIDYLNNKLKLVNPVITHQEGEQECAEGCLSFPGRGIKTIRPMTVTVEYSDENGQRQTLTASGSMAKCLCHEIDHLNGIVFLDRQAT